MRLLRNRVYALEPVAERADVKRVERASTTTGKAAQISLTGNDDWESAPADKEFDGRRKKRQDGLSILAL